MDPDFLEIEDVLEFHADQVRRFGGEPGLRDLGLLESAVAMPRQAFAGQFAHEDLFAMAAAYLFHIAKNHPFLDGNKRTALASALTFLDMNGVRCTAGDGVLYGLTIAVATSRATKSDAAVFFRKHGLRSRPAKPRGRMEEE